VAGGANPGVAIDDAETEAIDTWEGDAPAVDGRAAAGAERAKLALGRLELPDEILPGLELHRLGGNRRIAGESGASCSAALGAMAEDRRSEGSVDAQSNAFAQAPRREHVCCLTLRFSGGALVPSAATGCHAPAASNFLELRIDDPAAIWAKDLVQDRDPLNVVFVCRHLEGAKHERWSAGFTSRDELHVCANGEAHAGFDASVQIVVGDISKDNECIAYLLDMADCRLFS
jgi:hypothetical protein